MGLLLACGPSEVTHMTDAARVEIKALQFAPTAVQVRAGDSVWWINADLVPHNVTAGSGAWSSSTLAPGDSALIVMTESGRETYACTFHPGMEGVVDVEP